jgi:hypothetical protein
MTQAQNELAERIESELALLARVGELAETQASREASALMVDFLTELACAVRKSGAQTKDEFYKKYAPAREPQKTADESVDTSN